jgi:APA family basic amino acid/polyamine antiporter
MIPAAGLAGCLALVVTLPHGAAVAGLAVVLLGAAIWTIQRLR